MKRFARWLLHTAEVIYLEAHGWKPVTKVGHTYWIPPENYYWEKKRGQEHDHGHAVNSQKSATGREKYINDLREEGLWREDGD